MGWREKVKKKFMQLLKELIIFTFYLEVLNFPEIELKILNEPEMME